MDPQTVQQLVQALQALQVAQPSAVQFQATRGRPATRGNVDRTRSRSSSRNRSRKHNVDVFGIVPKPVTGQAPIPLYELGFPNGTVTLGGYSVQNCTLVKQGKQATVRYEISQTYEVDDIYDRTFETPDYTWQYVKNGVPQKYEPLRKLQTGGARGPHTTNPPTTDASGTTLIA